MHATRVRINRVRALASGDSIKLIERAPLDARWNKSHGLHHHPQDSSRENERERERNRAGDRSTDGIYISIPFPGGHQKEIATSSVAPSCLVTSLALGSISLPSTKINASHIASVWSSSVCSFRVSHLHVGYRVQSL